MWNETNPTTLYLGTTWELITSGKYILTGDIALQTGGSNSISIQKANLPNITLKVSSFSVTTQKHKHSMHIVGGFNDATPTYVSGNWQNSWPTTIYTDEAGGQNTGTASPNTENLGSGTAINIQPSYITLKFWKRLS